MLAWQSHSHFRVSERQRDLRVLPEYQYGHLPCEDDNGELDLFEPDLPTVILQTLPHLLASHILPAASSVEPDVVHCLFMTALA